MDISEINNMTILFGTTNLDGTGSSLNLNESNATQVNEFDFLNTKVYESLDGEVSATTLDTFGSTYIESSEWNKDGFKEVKLDADDNKIAIKDIVDVNIVNQSTTGVSDIEIINAKRGFIDTTGVSSNDNIDITVKSNSINWSNKFDIDTGAGNDSVTLRNGENSQFTSFDIDMGEGNDRVDISNMKDAAYSGQERVVDGGEGFDSLILNNDESNVFSGFEVVVAGESASSIELGNARLDKNGSDMGLIVSGFEHIDLESDMKVAEVAELSHCQSEYLSSNGIATDNFLAYTVTDTSSGSSDSYVVFSDTEFGSVC